MSEERPVQAPAKRRDTGRLVVAIGVAALVTAFAVLNTEDVKVNWIIETTQTPLIVVIVVSLLIGALFGRVWGVRRRRRRSRR